MWNWRAVVGLLALLTVLGVTILPVPAQDPAVRITGPSAAAAAARQGEPDAFQDMVSVEGKQVPLPEGVWRTAGRAVTLADRSGARRVVISVALVRLHGSAVDAAVLIQTNKLDAGTVWGKAAACERTDLYFAKVRYASDHDGSCAYAADVDAANRFDADVDPAWKQAMVLGAGQGWRFPAHWLEAAYRITDPRDAIQVRYLFDPPHDPMHGARAHVGPAAVQALAGWTEASWYAVGSGFRNRLGAYAGLPDWRRAEGSARAEASPSRMPQPVGSEPMSDTEHIGTKMVTYRIFGSLTDLTVNYLWLGSLPSAGGLAVVGAMASSALYFVHELAWSHFDKPAIELGDLPGVGVEGPGPGSG